MREDTLPGGRRRNKIDMSVSEISASCGRILEVDLSRKSAAEFSVADEDRRQYLGGKGLGLKYLYERLRPGIDPLGKDNVLAVMTGVLLGTGAPCTGRFAAVTKSPLTGLMTASSCGGPFGMALKTAGYEGLLIRGCADEPVLLEIDAEGARFSPADRLWGADTQEAQDHLQLSRHDGALVIGPAGEHRVLFANIASGRRFLGRGGMGAVMGAKRLKAVAAKGRKAAVAVEDPRSFEKARKKASAYIRANDFTGRVYRSFGTAANVMLCNEGGILPVRNFTDGRHPDAGAVSGETMREKYRTRPSTCKPCSILCGHKGTYSDGDHQIPEYETVGMLGPNLGIFDPDRIEAWNRICGRMGMDTISAGSTLAFVMEAGEKGLIDTGLAFGSPDGIEDALHDIAFRRGFGNEMAGGVRRLSARYGGEEFAIHVKGMETAAYDPRGAWGQGLAYAVANRGGCHLSATLMALEIFFGFLRPGTTRAKARFVRYLENLYAAVNSLPTCLFTAFAYMLEPPAAKYTPKWLLGFFMQYLPAAALALMDVRIYSRLFSAAAGVSLSQSGLLAAGERIHTLERHMNTREGVCRKDDALPARFLNEQRPCDDKNRGVPLETMLDDYYRLRGYDPQGIPTSGTLARLGIALSPGVPAGKDIAGYREVLPGKKPFKRLYLKVSFWFMGRAVAAAERVDPGIRKEFSRLPDGFVFTLGVVPAGPWMTVAKEAGGSIRYRGDTAQGAIDLRIQVKHMEAAFLLFSFQESTAAAVCRNRLSVDGDIDAACTVVRILDRVQALLLPRFLARRAVKRCPAWPAAEKWMRRIRLYAGILTGG